MSCIIDNDQSLRLKKSQVNPTVENSSVMNRKGYVNKYNENEKVQILVKTSTKRHLTRI